MSEKPILFSTPMVQAIQEDRKFLRLGKKAAIFTGGETGPGARPMHPDWARLDRDQCQATGVRFFFKSWGDWAPGTWHGDLESDITIYGDGDIHYDLEEMFDSDSEDRREHWLQRNFFQITSKSYWCDPLTCFDGECMIRVGKKSAGRLLDGREWNEYPGAGI